MLEDFMVEQNIIYNIMKNSVINNKCSHAYLINTNGYSKGFDMAMAFAKFILCPHNRVNNGSCGLCNQCKLIDNNSFSDIKILRSDGVWIKKEQTDILQAEFSKTSIGDSNKKVYIIDGVENLNISASNSILKFLEEPVDGIVAILIADNINKVLSTIVSRCQIFNLRNVVALNDNMIVNIANAIYSDSSLISNFVNDENSGVFIKNIINFAVYLEKNGVKTLVYIDSLWNCFFSSKDDYLIAFDILIMFYNDIINLKHSRKIILIDFEDVISEFVDWDYEKINFRINLLMDFKDRLYSNVNLGLLMDKLIIEMGCLHG